MKNNNVHVYGAGIAGCEAAWQLAKRGIKVTLFEMKPQKYTPCHKSPNFSELVCSNSLRSNVRSNAVGLLKEELTSLGSLFMEAALATQVPAGSALAVDREAFSEYITSKIRSSENIEVIEKEVCEISDDAVSIVATGPLTSDAFSDYLKDYLCQDYLHFYDAAAPIIDASSIDMSKVYFASRYGKGDADYLNCPMTKEEYENFYNALVNAKVAPVHGVDSQFASLKDEVKVFEGCMPVEVMAKRGLDTLLFGPLKPVGLPYPGTDKIPYAVVQLRPENIGKDMFNIVGFQTRLLFDEQRRVFGMIPGLENASFLRYGVMHRNTFIDSPRVLSPDLSLRKNKNVFFAGQITGTEGYVESCAGGLVAGINAYRTVCGLEPVVFEPISVIGALTNYISDPNVENFQPMNANFGLVPPLGYRVKGGKIAKNEALADRSKEYIERIKEILL